MIRQFSVRNFKNIATALDGEPLRLSPVNLFIGPNGVGKSSVLQAVDFLKAFYGEGIESYLRARGWEYRDLPNLRQSGKKIAWDVSFDVPSDTEGRYGGTYSLRISVLKRRYLNVGDEILVYKNDHDEKKALLSREGRAILFHPLDKEKQKLSFVAGLPSSVATYVERSPRERARNPHLMHFLRYVRSFRYASIFDVEELREPLRGYAEEIGPKGENLLPFLAKLQLNHPELFAEIRKETLRLFRTITDFKIKGYASAQAYKELEVFEERAVFNGRQVSDGFLRMLAVVALKYSPNPPAVLLFEEPENGVHPRLLEQMIAVFKSMAKRKRPHATQVLITTHSPYVLDLFRDTPAQVWALSRKMPKAGCEFRRLDEIFRRGLPEIPLGEAWYGDLLGGA